MKAHVAHSDLDSYVVAYNAIESIFRSSHNDWRWRIRILHNLKLQFFHNLPSIVDTIDCCSEINISKESNKSEVKLLAMSSKLQIMGSKLHQFPRILNFCADKEDVNLSFRHLFIMHTIISARYSSLNQPRTCGD